MRLFRIKISFVWWHLFLLTCYSFVTGWSWLESFSLLFVGGRSVNSCLIRLIWAPWGHFQLAWCDALLPLTLPFSLQAAWLWLQETCQDLYYCHWWFLDSILIFEDKPKDVMMQDVCSFLWVFSKTHLSLYSIVPLIHRSVALAKACKKVNPCSHFIGFGLQKSSYLDQIVKFIGWHATWNILIHTKVTTSCYNFLALLWLRKHCKLTI